MLNRIGGTGNDFFHGLLALSGFLYIGGSTNSATAASISNAGRCRAFTPVRHHQCGPLRRPARKVPFDRQRLARHLLRRHRYRSHQLPCRVPAKGSSSSARRLRTDLAGADLNIGNGTFIDAHHQRRQGLRHPASTCSSPPSTTTLELLLFGTYIGGAHNDYLGDTGDPRGSNHLFSNSSNLWLGTTTVHSSTRRDRTSRLGSSRSSTRTRRLPTTPTTTST